MTKFENCFFAFVVIFMGANVLLVFLLALSLYFGGGA